MIIHEEKFSFGILKLSATPMGKDWSITLTGGDREHIGAIALAIPRPSLRNPEECSATASVISVLGHKEDLIARDVALKLATALNSVISFSIGIHVKNPDTTTFLEIEKAVHAMINDFIETLS